MAGVGGEARLSPHPGDGLEEAGCVTLRREPERVFSRERRSPALS